jgi:hypothetical protein
VKANAKRQGSDGCLDYQIGEEREEWAMGNNQPAALDARKAQRFAREDHMSNAVKTVSDPEFTKAFLIRKQGGNDYV